MRSTFTQSILALTVFTSNAIAHCECGYTINSTSDESYAVFTDLYETDFLHISNLAKRIGWRPQEYKVSPEDSRGPFGKSFAVANVITNPLKNHHDWAGESVRGGDAGLQLWVRSQDDNKHLGAAELGGDRQDMIYGSYRVGMKMSNQNGTCGAFFWYSTDTQEIDIEFLSKQFTDDKSTVNYVLQTPQSKEAGFDASKTPYFEPLPVDFRPDDAFHEYRFDWLKQKVSFYIDGEWQYDMEQGIPTSGGHLVLNHWSNGDGNWSAGPPERDAVMTVAYVKAYFNSTSVDRHNSHDERCPQADEKKLCQIPEQRGMPDPSGDEGNKTARTFFFTKLGEDHTPGQIVYDSSAAPGSIRLMWTTSLVVFSVIVSFFGSR